MVTSNFILALIGQLIVSGLSPDDENLFFSFFTIISDRITIYQLKNYNLPQKSIK